MLMMYEEYLEIIVQHEVKDLHDMNVNLIVEDDEKIDRLSNDRIYTIDDNHVVKLDEFHFENIQLTKRRFLKEKQRRTNE